MDLCARVSAPLLVLALTAGCTTTAVSNREITDPSAKIARPDRILVREFATTSTELHAESALGQPSEPTTAQIKEELDALRQLAAVVAEQPVTKIREMGLPAPAPRGSPRHASATS